MIWHKDLNLFLKRFFVIWHYDLICDLPVTGGPISVRSIFSDPIRLSLISVNIKQIGGSDHDKVSDGMQEVCVIAPLKGMNHSVVLSSDIVADLAFMLALNVMCV